MHDQQHKLLRVLFFSPYTEQIITRSSEKQKIYSPILFHIYQYGAFTSSWKADWRRAQDTDKAGTETWCHTTKTQFVVCKSTVNT